MRRIIYVLTIFIFVWLFYSCNEEVDPKIDLPEYYSFNCIIRCDSSYQVATLSKLYDVTGYDPLSNTVDPFVRGAKVILIDSISRSEKSIYQFRDTSIARLDSSRYSTPLNYYYLKYFQFKQPSYLKMEITLPNGNRLKSSTFAAPLDIYTINTFKNKYPQYKESQILEFDWSEIKYLDANLQPYFLPEFIIKYQKYESGQWTKYQKIIPVYYVEKDDNEIAIYPSIQPSLKRITYDTLTIRKTFESISAGDTHKDNYLIDNVVFMLQVLDENFATYISVQKHYTDDYSLSVTELDYTTISGAKGIFGSMQTIQLNVPFIPMIKSLGYRTN